jgi:putative transposase
MCGLLAVPRSSFYAWRNRVETATQLRRRELGVEIARVFAASRQTSGCRRVTAQLNRDGIECSVGLVADLMRELGLKAVQPRAYKRTTIPGEQPVTAPDLIGRDFSADAPGERLVGDITYLRTGEGWLYLATVIDLATRMVVGWQLADHMRTSLVTDAIAMAIAHGHVEPDAVFHSDRGCQGGFNWSSQHLVITEVFGGSSTTGSRSGAACAAEVARSSEVSTRGRGRVLGRDRQGVVAGGGSHCRRRVAAGRAAVVPQRWRHAAI